MPPNDKKTVTVDAEHYRSLVLGKLRAEIAAKQAALELASKLDAVHIIQAGYYKMPYYKMPYYKMGHREQLGEAVVNPVIGAGPVGGQRHE